MGRSSRSSGSTGRRPTRTANGSKRETRRSIEKLRKAQREEEEMLRGMVGDDGNADQAESEQPGDDGNTEQAESEAGEAEPTGRPYNAAIHGYRLTDAGNSERLIALVDGKLRYVNVWGKWIVYRER